MFRLFPSFTNPANQSAHTLQNQPDCFYSIPESFITSVTPVKPSNQMEAGEAGVEASAETVSD